MLQVGIVGLPNVGKSTLFNALTAGEAPAENYPFCTVDPNIGIVAVPDERLERIQRLTGSRERVPTFIRFVDIAGLVRGASRGEGLGNQFLAQIREVDAIAHVVRLFSNPDVTHVTGSVDPQGDVDVVETELLLADLETLERHREKVEKKARSGERDAQRAMEVMNLALDALEAGKPLRNLELSPSQTREMRELNLLTLKPVFFVANVDEDWLDGSSASPSGGREISVPGGGEVVYLSLALEAELALLEQDERREFLHALGLQEPGTARVIRAAYDVLNLITFFSSNEKQATAWTLPRGSRAPEAAGVIHSDFQRGFIRAETISFQDFSRFGSMKAAREAGAIRSEGKDYVVADGDILLFRFNL
jgi:GTP-binding protein YchF